MNTLKQLSCTPLERAAAFVMECNQWCNRLYVWWINRHIRKQEANIRSSHELEQQKGGVVVEPEDRAAEEQSLTSGPGGSVELREGATATPSALGAPSVAGGGGSYGATVAAKQPQANAERQADKVPASHQNTGGGSGGGGLGGDGDDDYYAAGGAFYSHIKSSEVEFFSHEEGEFFFHAVGEAVWVREEAEVGAPRVGEAPLEKGRVYESCERLQQGERVFFKLARDGEGWGSADGDGGRPRPADAEHDPPEGWVEGGGGEQALEEVPEPYFMYRVRPGYRVHARADPDMKSKQLGRSVQGGELFEECQQRRQQDGQVFLRLPDFSGWVFKIAANGEQVLDRVPQLPRRLKAKTKLAARVMPDIFSGRTGKTFEEEAELGISRRIAADDRMQVFYKLADGSGWVFKHSAQGEQMLTELQPPKGAEDCVIM